MAVTCCRSLGQLMRFGRQRFTVLANNVARRKSCHALLSASAVYETRAAWRSALFLRNFSSTQPSPQSETQVTTLCIKAYFLIANFAFFIFRILYILLHRFRIRKVFRIGTVRYNWPTSAHASQAFSRAHCTDSEDFCTFPFYNFSVAYQVRLLRKYHISLVKTLLKQQPVGLCGPRVCRHSQGGTILFQQIHRCQQRISLLA